MNLLSPSSLAAILRSRAYRITRMAGIVAAFSIVLSPALGLLAIPLMKALQWQDAGLAVPLVVQGVLIQHERLDGARKDAIFAQKTLIGHGATLPGPGAFAGGPGYAPDSWLAAPAWLSRGVEKTISAIPGSPLLAEPIIACDLEYVDFGWPFAVVTVIDVGRIQVSGIDYGADEYVSADLPPGAITQFGPANVHLGGFALNAFVAIVTWLAAGHASALLARVLVPSSTCSRCGYPHGRRCSECGQWLR